MTPSNTTITTSEDRYRRRLNLLDRLEGAVDNPAIAQATADHRKLYDKAAPMIMSEQMKAFELREEPQSVLDAYGSGAFASGCLLARRLVETGVTFVEVAFQSISISHAYSSTYSVANFTNSLEYSNVTNSIPLSDYNDGIYATVRNSQNQLIPVYVISQVMISEQFQPLIGVSVRTKGKLTARFEYKTKRDISLNVSNAQITEVNSKDVSVEVGYIKNNMKMPWKSQGRTVTLKNEINFRLNISVTNNLTSQRKIEEVNTITNGNINVQVRPNVSYTVNSKLNVQLYVDSNVNTPQVSNSYTRSTTRVGFKVLFNLAQ